MSPSTKKIEAMIFNIRNQRVMLDSDLAELYGVETRALNQAVKRNSERFPDDFMIKPSFSDLAELRSQIVISSRTSNRNHLITHKSKLFSENGVAMLSSILKSKQAIQVNIAIIRTFTRLRSFLAMENNATQRVDKLEARTQKLFKIVFERLDSLDEEVSLKSSPKQHQKIGLK